MFVEDNTSLLAPNYSRPLHFTFDSSLGARGEFHYVFDEGGLSCSEAASAGYQMCLVSRGEMSTIRRHNPTIVYADNGCWVDNADGEGTRRRDFVLVCGPHVYTCEFVNQGTAPQSRVPSVQQLFTELAALGCGTRVIAYAMAVPPLSPNTPNDPTLYLLLGDLHMPPVSWFYNPTEMGIMLMDVTERDPPAWFASLPAMRRQRDHLMRNYFSLAAFFREHSHRREGRGPIMGNPDIFQTAGQDLARFINGLANLSGETKHLLHFIQTGDMFELWLGRDYQYQEGHQEPSWIDEHSVNRVSNWALEVMIQNFPVFDALHRLQDAGLAEIKYLWGNHDAYLKSRDVTGQLGLPARDATYRGLSRDFFAEHGHRFDRSNHDNITAWDGPAGANAAYYIPVLRSAEPLARALTGIGHPSSERDCYLLGATLVYLHERFDLHRSPYAIYLMGHTHDRKLIRYTIRTEYSLHGVP